MKVRNSRLYPYPILSNSNDDYIDNVFLIHREFFHDEEKAIFKCKTVIHNELIIKMINEGKMFICFHIECPSTKYREIFKSTNLNDFEVVLPTSYLNDVVETIGFLIASEKIEKYTNDNFNNFFAGREYTIDKFLTLGFTDTVEFTINKKINSDGDIPSIFLVNITEEQNEMSYDLTGDQIVIYLPRKAYDIYESMKGSHIKIKQAMINVSVLALVIDEVKKSGNDYDQKAWYIILEQSIKKLGKDYEDGLSSERFINTDSLRIAQYIMKNIVIDSFDELNNLKNIANEEI